MYEYGDILVMEGGSVCKVVFIDGNRITIELINENGMPERHTNYIDLLRKPVKVIHARESKTG